MAERPTGTVTFLFTDVEGSTRLWEEHPDGMRDALARHDEIMEHHIADAGGFVHSTAGDAYSAAFSDPLGAIGAAIAAQRALDEAEWPVVGQMKVRMAVHTGVAHERGDDYYGPALNRCARILSAAHGGQIVTSRGTEELVRHRMQPGTSLKDLGEHQLKDLGHPEHIFQVVAPGLGADFAELRSLDPNKNNLPLQLTSFVGREDELRDVKKRLIDTRLLTLTGVGGSGKTRLSLQAAAESAEDFKDGVWLVELAAVGDPDKLPAWVAESLKLNRGQGGPGGSIDPKDNVPPIDQVVEYLRKREALLILDNCEHLIGAAADFASFLLRSCPDVKILATSREGLGIAGETLWQVPSLEMPNRFDVDELGGTGADALRLFQERASAVNANFEINDETYPYVLKICRRLDGMPLAIELAAARAKSLDVARIADRLDDRFRLLTGGSRTALPRQQTLAAAVEWSYELLEEPEQVFFNRLATFRGGFTLDAAEAVCEGGVVDEFDIVDYLSSLVDKSMVVWEGGAGDRYRLLETLRQYAMGKLKDSGEADEIRTRHAQFFLDFAEKAAPHLRGHEQVEWVERLEADHENFGAALAFTAEHEMTQVTARMAAALEWYWGIRNHKEEQREWLAQLLGLPDIGDDRTILRLMIGYGWFLLWDNQYDQLRTHIEDTIGFATRTGDKAAQAEALLIQAWLYANLDDYKRYEESSDLALETAISSGDDWAIAWANFIRGWLERLRANVDEATPYFDRATNGMRKTGDTLGLAYTSGAVAIVARYRMDYDSARRLHEEAIEGFRSLGDRGAEAFNLACLGIVNTLLGDYEMAIQDTESALAIYRDVDVGGRIAAEVFDVLADAQIKAGSPEDGIASLREGVANVNPSTEITGLALLVETLVKGFLVESNPDLAAKLWGWASATRDEVGRPVPPPSRAEYAQIEQLMDDAVSDRLALAADGAMWTYEDVMRIFTEELDRL